MELWEKFKKNQWEEKGQIKKKEINNGRLTRGGKRYGGWAKKKNGMIGHLIKKVRLMMMMIMERWSWQWFMKIRSVMCSRLQGHLASESLGLCSLFGLSTTLFLFFFTNHPCQLTLLSAFTTQTHSFIAIYVIILLHFLSSCLS